MMKSPLCEMIHCMFIMQILTISHPTLQLLLAKILLDIEKKYSGPKSIEFYDTAY